MLPTWRDYNVYLEFQQALVLKGSWGLVNRVKSGKYSLIITCNPNKVPNKCTY